MARLIGVFLCALWGMSAFQNARVRDAAAALQHGEFAAAERLLRAEAADHPDDAWTLSLLGYSLDQQNRGREADPLHRRAVELSAHSAEILNNYGTHLWKLEDYTRAESVFSEALAAAPTYFNVLYNLGVMASYAGDYDRAREVLRSALSQQSNNVDVLYRLATVEEASKRWEDAVMLLAQAGRLAPKRADVQRLLAVAASELGALSDASAAWDRYLALEPKDETAQRERAYALVKMGKLEEGIAGLERYLARHADDKVALFELGQAQRSTDAAAALQHFDQAIALDPNYGAARAARGSLNYQSGNFEAALKDLELGPKNAATLDRLGQTYQALDRTADAVPVLRRAAQLAPDESKIILHYGRALADAGQTSESKEVLERFRQLGPEKKVVVPEGLVSYLSLTPEARRKDDRVRLEIHVREHPDDLAAQIAWLTILLEEHDHARVAGVAGHISALKPDAGILAAVGHDLLEAGEPALAKRLLQRNGSVSLDFALAMFRSGTSAEAAIEVMDKVPEAARGSDYYLARARMLESAGMLEGASAARQQALQELAEAARAQPDRREILLTQATTLELVKRTSDALALLNQIQARWPEWPHAWAAKGIVLVLHGRQSEAKQALEAASTLGLRNPIADFFLSKSRQVQKPGADEATYVTRFFDGGLLKP
jgi:tetratricopeptide (TPR) repeat protein